MVLEKELRVLHSDLKEEEEEEKEEEQEEKKEKRHWARLGPLKLQSPPPSTSSIKATPPNPSK